MDRVQLIYVRIYIYIDIDMTYMVLRICYLSSIYDVYMATTCRPFNYSMYNMRV